jgi:hypothetical protein
MNFKHSISAFRNIYLYIYYFRIATAENFKYLMDQLKREAEKNRKMELSIKLSETLMIPGGFTAYYDYISSINVFCKVVLTRPLKFSDDAVTIFFKLS